MRISALNLGDLAFVIVASPPPMARRIMQIVLPSTSAPGCCRSFGRRCGARGRAPLLFQSK